jgi:hypothetical protein
MYLRIGVIRNQFVFFRYGDCYAKFGVAICCFVCFGFFG